MKGPKRVISPSSAEPVQAVEQVALLDAELVRHFGIGLADQRQGVLQAVQKASVGVVERGHAASVEMRAPR